MAAYSNLLNDVKMQNLHRQDIIDEEISMLRIPFSKVYLVIYCT